MAEIDYSETDQRLAIRIRAHTKFANVQLEDWLSKRIDVPSGGRLLEIGCGNGNFFPVYSSRLGSKGLIVGFDVSNSLLKAAQERARSLETASFVFKWDFNDPFPLLNGDFDCVLSPFAAYYAKDAGRWIEEAARVTRAGGQILLLGPAADNAAELYELNEAVTGVGHVEETDYTTRRLESDFFPALRKRFGDAVKSEIIDRRIEFPTARDFAEYYRATWLYEKTAKKAGRDYSVDDVEKKVSTKILSKRVVVLEARS